MNDDHEAIRKVQAETVRQLEERHRLGVPHPPQQMSDAQREQYRKQANRAHVPGVGITRPIIQPTTKEVFK
jgi:hypothetical protein